MATTAPAFTGFRPEAIQFLADLRMNNDRAWFQPRKADYERLLKEPLEQLCVALEERFRALDLPFRADPAKSPFRIYRDVRFSKDKSPYKTNVGASFPFTDTASAAGDEPRHGAGGYFHIEPGEIYVGGGMWHPEPARLAAFRAAVDHDPKAVRSLIDDPDFVKTYGAISGEKLKRVPTGYPPDHPEAELLKHKDVVFGRRLADDDVFSPRLADTIADTLAAGVPLMRFMVRLPA